MADTANEISHGRPTFDVFKWILVTNLTSDLVSNTVFDSTTTFSMFQHKLSPRNSFIKNNETSTSQIHHVPEVPPVLDAKKFQIHSNNHGQVSFITDLLRSSVSRERTSFVVDKVVHSYCTEQSKMSSENSESKRQKASKENREEVDILAYPELFKEVRRQAVNKLGLSPNKALMACSELCRALTCKGEHEDPMSLSLPPLLDQLWHVALLNTEKYAQFCEESFGHFIHHTTLTDADSVGDKNKRVDATVKMYRFLFDSQPIAEFWEREKEPEDDKLTIHQQIAPQKESFTICLKNQQGEQVDFIVNTTTRIHRIKSTYAFRRGLAEDFKLVLNGRPLADSSNLGDYDIGAGEVIYVILDLTGC